MTTPQQATTTTERLAQDPRRRVWDRPADEIRGDAERYYTSVRDNPDLTSDAKQRLIATKYVAIKQRLDALNSSEPSRKAADVETAKRAAFGIDDLLARTTPAEAAAISLSFRDAQARAAQLINAREAQNLLDTARQSGDELLVRAIGNHALNTLGMSDVADSYLACVHPDRAETVQRVAQLNQMPDFAGLMEFVCPTPAEVASMSSGQLDEMTRG
jgi:hypothetical protein